ncbi:DUF1642 domain-containing protein [Streptococcus phocae subsp. phocae]
MNINELKKGDKVWVRGSIDCDGDLMLGDALTYIKSSLIYNMDQKDIKLDGYDMSQAKESLKPEIPQFVADWIEEHKENYSRWDDGAKADFVFRAINDLFRFGEGRSLCCFDIDDELSKWTTENAFNFINAILFSYTVKEEKNYQIRDKRLEPNSNCLNFDKVNKCWFFSDGAETKGYTTKHTRQKLEQSGFNVFDDDNYEVSEVAE